MILNVQTLQASGRERTENFTHKYLLAGHHHKPMTESFKASSLPTPLPPSSGWHHFPGASLARGPASAESEWTIEAAPSTLSAGLLPYFVHSKCYETQLKFRGIISTIIWGVWSRFELIHPLGGGLGLKQWLCPAGFEASILLWCVSINTSTVCYYSRITFVS